MKRYKNLLNNLLCIKKVLAGGGFMTEVRKKPKLNLNFYDALFMLLLIVTFYFMRNIICQLMMIIFCGYTCLKFIVKDRKIKFTPYFFFSALFIFYGALNIVAGNVIDNGVAKTIVISLTLNLIMTFCIVQYIYLTQNVYKVLKITEYSIFIISLLVVLFSLDTIEGNRLGEVTDTINSNRLGILCGFAIILCLYFINEYKQNKGWYFLRICIYLIIILLTGSRKSLLMVLFAFMLWSVIKGPKVFLTFIASSIFIVAILYFVLMKIPLFYNIVGHRFEDLFELLETNSTDDGSINDRQELIKIGWQYILKKPWTGYGYDCFKTISGLGWNGVFFYYSHNNYIELLFSGGILAFVLYYLGVVYLLASIIKKARQNKCMQYLLIILLSKLIIEYTYVSYHERIDSYIVAILLGVMLSVKKEDKKAQGVSLCHP